MWVCSHSDELFLIQINSEKLAFARMGRDLMLAVRLGCGLLLADASSQRIRAANRATICSLKYPTSKDFD